MAAALIALVGVLASAAVAWITARATVRSEHVKRQAELALQISQIVATHDEKARSEAMRRFAVGILKVVEPRDHEQFGMVFFIPMNSRVTMGRANDNDIVLEDDKNWLSRWHAGFIASQHEVWIDDFASKNGTKVQGSEIKGSRLLKHGDTIIVGPYVLEFRLVRENTILSQ
jgi:hypothetical protein